MVMMDGAVAVAAFQDCEHAEAALADLESAGFREDEIGFVMHGVDTGRDVVPADDRGSRVGEGAATGAIAGAGIGGAMAAAATLFVPGVGPILSGGILASIVGGGLAGAAAGGVLGGLIGLGVPEEEAHYYEREFHTGRPIVTVRAGSRYEDAREIMRRHGADELETRQESEAPTLGPQATHVEHEDTDSSTGRQAA
jgi:hypothetical protein